ncbi:histidine phosphatase family protein [Terricaulis sp.]|uniref:histidine phosphatase family protein n=1 Tax=Terricaulis sp. TaxID=2768686 RepID=UPI002AC78973|nr:histidine phosphatase family protein [Terricaulis sp.]MDZ4690131.1 histidine phosphatase family protein [Terricaulis sp.]
MTTTMAPDETLDRRSAVRVGFIVIARHGQPHADRSVRIDQQGFREWWAGYDLAGLHPDERPPEKLVDLAGKADVIYASTLQRAIHTAQMVAGGREIVTDPVFVEAPLPPPAIWGKRRPGAWGVYARAAWWFGHTENGESRAQAELRAEAAVATLTAQALRGQNVLLCAHGWFNRMMRPILRAQGWREVEDGGDRYWSYRRYEKVK